MSSVIELSAFKGARPLERDFSGPSRAADEPRAAKCWRHRLVFRSYELIAKSGEAELVRDVGVDVEKAKTKLRKIREQIVIDRDKVAARSEMMSKAEAKLSAAIEAAQSAPSPALEVKERRTSSEALSHRREFREAMRQRIRMVALSLDLSASRDR